jgi:hypothetical protein
MLPLAKVVLFPSTLCYHAAFQLPNVEPSDFSSTFDKTIAFEMSSCRFS